MRLSLPILVLALLPAGCFVQSVCLEDHDCPYGEICRDDGACMVPACASDADCPGAQVCDEPAARCVLECEQDGDCLLGEVCEHHRCVAAWNRVAAPAFEGVDENDSSPTTGQTVSLASWRARVLVLYFASST